MAQRKQLLHLFGSTSNLHDHKQDGEAPNAVEPVQRQEAEEGEEEKGTVPNMMLSAAEEVLKGPDDKKLDGPAPHTFSSTKGTAGTSPSKGLQITLGAIGFNSRTPNRPINEGPSRKDENLTVGSVSVNWSNPGNKPTGAFGSEAFRPGFRNIAWTSNPKKGKVKLDFDLDVECPWGVNDGGRTDVPSATAGVVTEDTYQQIVQDLTPKKKESCWVAPRQVYWSKAICERHEKYHSTDDKKWAEGKGKKGLITHLKKKTIPGTDVGTEVNALMTTAMQKMKTANMAFYKGGASSYYSYAGEKRAFGDGKTPYQNLAKGVKKHGKKLEKAAAKSK